MGVVFCRSSVLRELCIVGVVYRSVLTTLKKNGAVLFIKRVSFELHRTGYGGGYSQAVQHIAVFINPQKSV